MDVQPSKKLTIYVLSKEANYIDKCSSYIMKLANVQAIEFISDKGEVKEKCANIVSDFAEILIPLGELVDMDKEIARLNKELETLKKEIARGEGMLRNQGFLAKAPKQLVDAENEKLATNKEKFAKLEARIKELME